MKVCKEKRIKSFKLIKNASNIRSILLAQARAQTTFEQNEIVFVDSASASIHVVASFITTLKQSVYPIHFTEFKDKVE